MKKSLNSIVLIIFLISSSLTAQQRLKGNREVTSENRNLSEFTKIEVIDNVDVFLVYNESTCKSGQANFKAYKNS